MQYFVVILLFFAGISLFGQDELLDRLDERERTTARVIAQLVDLLAGENPMTLAIIPFADEKFMARLNAELSTKTQIKLVDKSALDTLIGSQYELSNPELFDGDTIARRFDYRNIFEDLGQGFLIDIGTQALIFIDGLLVAICPCGRIDVNHLPELKKYLGKDCPVSLVLARSGQIELGFLLKRLMTKDKVMVDFSVQFLLQLFDPSSFFYKDAMPERAGANALFTNKD